MDCNPTDRTGVRQRLQNAFNLIYNYAKQGYSQESNTVRRKSFDALVFRFRLKLELLYWFYSCIAMHKQATITRQYYRESRGVYGKKSKMDLCDFPRDQISFYTSKFEPQQRKEKEHNILLLRLNTELSISLNNQHTHM